MTRHDHGRTRRRRVRVGLGDHAAIQRHRAACGPGTGPCQTRWLGPGQPDSEPAAGWPSGAAAAGTARLAAPWRSRYRRDRSNRHGLGLPAPAGAGQPEPRWQAQAQCGTAALRPGPGSLPVSLESGPPASHWHDDSHRHSSRGRPGLSESPGSLSSWAPTRPGNARPLRRQRATVARSKCDRMFCGIYTAEQRKGLTNVGSRYGVPGSGASDSRRDSRPGGPGCAPAA
jgi:hypothetical protein